ncbi:hypothetical protein N0V90_003591 [Kalmusia sp. IMI 367209]|nr:hypothetical protein N0V90_003591 [Kalmusia sp. IMI 367209]
MKVQLAIAFVASSFQLCDAHYNFPYFLVNETMSSAFKYTRRVSDATHAGNGPSYPPFYARDLSSSDIRCGRNATVSGIDTEVATVIAGTKVGFRPNFWIKATGSHALVLHDGPLSAYLARSPVQSPEGLQAWDGSGGAFFKIAERGPSNNQSWFSREDLEGIQFSEGKAEGRYPADEEYISFPVPEDRLEEYLAPGGATRIPTYKMPGPSVWRD